MTPDNPEIESQVPPAVEAPAVEAPAKPESRADRLAKEFGFDSAEAHGARVEEAREREAAKKR